ncbi:hypothetical protein KFK09_001047 [Dendrobium nobile]|uniref:Uncharacterized protein n=1 Tax=Dendrobium nobile TaxID=94219 RepID=A0A8T3CAL9_DENNO|nr:hypothetical protein KFK09_001047 [Dendrobium nobile]
MGLTAWSRAEEPRGVGFSGDGGEVSGASVEKWSFGRLEVRSWEEVVEAEGSEGEREGRGCSAGGRREESLCGSSVGRWSSGSRVGSEVGESFGSGEGVVVAPNEGVAFSF